MIKIIIGDRVLNQIHRSVFIVEINQMSGDADSYEIAKFTFKSKATTDLSKFKSHKVMVIIILIALLWVF
jgi:hypothetical protein